MLYPDELEKPMPSDDLQRWAQLEGKSDLMADELIQNMQHRNRCCQKASRFSTVVVFAVLLVVFVVAAIVALESKYAADPPAESGIVSSDILQLDLP